MRNGQTFEPSFAQNQKFFGQTNATTALTVETKGIGCILIQKLSGPNAHALRLIAELRLNAEGSENLEQGSDSRK